MGTDVENELHPGSRDRRRGFQIESITVIKSDHQLPLSRNFNRNFETSARRKQNQQKVNSINALDIFFFQFRVYSRCFNTIRILYTLFLRVNTFRLLTLSFFSCSYLDKTDKWTNLCTINRLRKLTDLNNGLCILVSFFFFFSTLNTQFS